MSGGSDYNFGNSTTTNPTTSYGSNKSGRLNKDEHILSPQLKDAIQHMVANISKSFIVAWYTNISQTNHDFVASCDVLIDNAMTKFAELCVAKLDKYKIGQMVMDLLHDHILQENLKEKRESTENQIDTYEYAICQSSVVRLFGLLSSDELRKVIFTYINQKESPMKTQRAGQQNQRYTTQQARSSKSDSQDESDYFNDCTTTSALYTLVIAMLTKAAFMPIIDTISSPCWLYAVIIWFCKKEERDQERKNSTASNLDSSSMCASNSEFHSAYLSKSNLTSIIVTNSMGQDSVDLDDGGDMLPAINFENPISVCLKRPLDNIEIYATEEVKGNNSCYTLYCISYDGLVYKQAGSCSKLLDDNFDQPIIDKRNTANSRITRNQAGSSKADSLPENDADYRKSYRKKMSIKRRFREFVILQLRLEENPKIRPYLKNIPKPTKLKAATQSIFSLPGITNVKLDKSTIKLRQRFLERFLIALNNSPFIANSYEFKEFFSYNQNAVNSISKSKSLILQVNLNKVFVDSVKSAYNMIKASLPGDDKRLNTEPVPDPDAWLTELQQSTLKLHVQTRTSHSKMYLERCIDLKLLSMNDSPTKQKKSSSLGRNIDRDCEFNQYNTLGGSLKGKLVKSQSMSSSPLHLALNQASRSSSSNSQLHEETSKSASNESLYFDASDDIESQSDHKEISEGIQTCDSVPMATKLIDIIHYSVSRDPSCNNSFVNFMARIFLGSTIERYLAKFLDLYLNLKTAAFCVDGITSSIWDESDDPPLDLENASLDEAVKHVSKLLEQNMIYKDYIPNQILKPLISNQTRFYLSQLSSQRRNKFVIYSFIANLLNELESVNETRTD